jgi:hypothetical protein
MKEKFVSCFSERGGIAANAGRKRGIMLICLIWRWGFVGELA